MGTKVRVLYLNIVPIPFTQLIPRVTINQADNPFYEPATLSFDWLVKDFSYEEEIHMLFAQRLESGPRNFIPSSGQEPT
jgi:hypothetical protein